MDMTEIESTVQRLRDEAAVRDVTARFADAAVHADYDAFGLVWTEDAEWVIGGNESQPFERRASGVEAIVELYRSLREERDYFIQFAVQGPIRIDGDHATARSFCHESAQGPGSYYRNNGVWFDQLRRTADGWRFVSRTYQYLWLDFSEYSGDVFPALTRDGDVRDQAAAAQG